MTAGWTLTAPTPAARRTPAHSALVRPVLTVPAVCSPPAPSPPPSHSAGRRPGSVTWRRCVTDTPPSVPLTTTWHRDCHVLTASVTPGTAPLTWPSVSSSGDRRRGLHTRGASVSTPVGTIRWVTANTVHRVPHVSWEMACYGD